MVRRVALIRTAGLDQGGGRVLSRSDQAALTPWRIAQRFLPNAVADVIATGQRVQVQARVCVLWDVLTRHRDTCVRLGNSTPAVVGGESANALSPP